MLKTGISVAEQSITEGNTDLGACLSQKKISREDIQRGQSKIEMAIKRKAELESEIVLIEKKKQKLLK